MFGLLVPHRPIQPSPHQVISSTQYLFNVAASPSFSHLAVFLLPDQILPPNTGAAIYIKLPSSPSQPNQDFKLKGALSMEKQSALFRLDESSKSHGDELVAEAAMTDDARGDSVSASAISGYDMITVGVSIEPIAQLQVQVDTLHNTPPGSQSMPEQDRTPPAVVTRALARRVGQHAHDYLTGFATGPTGSETVSLKKVQEWWVNFEKKLNLDANFIARQQDSSG